MQTLISNLQLIKQWYFDCSSEQFADFHIPINGSMSRHCLRHCLIAIRELQLCIYCERATAYNSHWPQFALSISIFTAFTFEEFVRNFWISLILLFRNSMKTLSIALSLVSLVVHVFSQDVCNNAEGNLDIKEVVHLNEFLYFFTKDELYRVHLDSFVASSQTIKTSGITKITPPINMAEFRVAFAVDYPNKGKRMVFVLEKKVWIKVAFNCS